MGGERRMKPEPTQTPPGVDPRRLVVPRSIFLQWFGDSDDFGPLPEGGEGEVTWCRDRVFDGDVEYVSALEIRASLAGHECSELWGEGGLLAATMRCVTAVSKIEDLVTTDHETKDAFIARVRGILGHNTQTMAGEALPSVPGSAARISD